MRRLTVIGAFVALASAGCLRTTQYRCTSDADCGAGAVCEATNYCSFADSACPDGRRYGEFSGDYANRCVGDLPPGTDGGVDMMTTPDMLGDACPSSYMQLGSIANRRYRVITNDATWDTQQAACAADGQNAYLAVPNDQAELDALLDAADEFRIWVGIDDRMTEGTYVTANGGTFSATDPLWAGNEPNNQPFSGGGGPNGADCVVGRRNDGALYDDRCTQTYAAVCECEP